MPAGEPLKVMLDRAERRCPLILTTTKGKPWSSDGFQTSCTNLFASLNG